MKCAVIGAGSWGTTVASLVAPFVPTVIWARRPDVAEDINRKHRNERYLKGFELSSELAATDELDAAVSDATLIVMGVPSHGYRDVLSRTADAVPRDVPILSLSKGIESGTLMRMTEVTMDVLPDHDRSVVGVLTGPNLAREILDGQPAATVIAMEDQEAARSIQQVFLITRALAEMTRLGVAMGGDVRTFAGLAGLGDLIATCNSSQSRNHQVGYGLGHGRELGDIVEEMSEVAEGVKSTRGVLALAHTHGVEMPIAEKDAHCGEGGIRALRQCRRRPRLARAHDEGSSQRVSVALSAHQQPSPSTSSPLRVPVALCAHCGQSERTALAGSQSPLTRFARLSPLKGGRDSELLSCCFGRVAGETTLQMVVHETHRLHEGVSGCRTHKAPAALLEIL